MNKLLKKARKLWINVHRKIWRRSPPGLAKESIIPQMGTKHPYLDFTERLKLLVSKHPALITITLSNIFTMRLIGNKTHGDLAEIAIAEFINQYMY